MAPSRAASDSAHFKNQISKPLKIPDDSTRPETALAGTSGAGSTHAWAEVYVPGAGWISFDPTNLGVGGFNLIPVGTARDIRQVMPVVGSFVAANDAF